MRVLLILTGLLFSSFAYSHFYEVTKKICDNKEVPIADGERIYFNGSIFGYGKNQTNEEGEDFRIVDFFAVLRTNFDPVEFQPTSPLVGAVRKRSCDAESLLLPFQGQVFKKATFADDEIFFEDFLSCSQLYFQLNIQSIAPAK